jgi:hypothetical protein
VQVEGVARFGPAVKVTVKAPTAVSGGPGPSLTASVATEPEIATPARVPPDGTWARLQPAVHEGCRAPENVTSTLSMRPSLSASAVRATTTVFSPDAVVVVVGPVVVLLGGTVVAVVLRSGAPLMTMRAVAEWVAGTKAAAPRCFHFTATSSRSPRVRSTDGGRQGTVTAGASPGRHDTAADSNVTIPTRRCRTEARTARLLELPGTSASS